MNDEKEFFLNYLKEYNKTWYDKDIEKVKEFYSEENRLIYYDNHKGNDTYTVADHLTLISDFFTNGKKTESGQVEELLIEDFRVFSNKTSACLCYIARYKTFPKPGVRTTMYLENNSGKWRIVHVHCSFEPEC